MVLMSTCPFCQMDPERIIWSSDLVYAIRDGYPVSRGHTLIIPHEHVETYFDASSETKAALWQAIEELKVELDARFSPDGYNIGINAGATAGQTIMHLHVHLIPRYAGDIDDPRGGVRGVIPEKQKY